MKLFFDTEIAEGFDYRITVGGQSATVNSLTQKASFDLENDKEYDITIEQINNSLCKADFVFCLLTFLIQGIFYLLTMDSGNEWYNDFCIYQVKATAKYKTSKAENDTIYFLCKKEKYHLKGFYESLSSLECKSSIDMTIENTKNFALLKKCFFYGIEKVFSVFSVGFILMRQEDSTFYKSEMNCRQPVRAAKY